MTRRHRSSHAYHGSKAKSNTNQASRKRRQGNSVLGLGIFVLLLLVVAVIVGYISIKDLYNDRVVEGIAIGGVDLSGMTRDEAYVELTNKLNEDIKKISLTITYRDKVWEYTSDDLMANTNAEQLVDQVMLIGHSGSIKQRMDDAKRAKEGGYGHLVASVGIDDSLIDYHLENIRPEVECEAVPASLEFNPGDYDYEEYAANAPVADLFSYTEAVMGIELDKEATVAAIREDLTDDLHANVGLMVKEIEPESEYPPELRPENIVLLYHSSTQLPRTQDHKPNVDRNHNIKMALTNYDGLTILPQVAYSYNIILGERTPEAGYRKAGTINKEGRIELDYGGGICQGASTLYRAVFFAGCEIIERNHHRWPSYYEFDGDPERHYGMDAMVNWASSDDFTFKNPHKTPLFMNFYFMYIDGEPRYVDIDIYGLPLKDGMTIGMDTSDTEEIPGPEPTYIPKDDLNEVYEYDPIRNEMVCTYVKPRDGRRVKVYRLWKDKDDNVVEREFMYEDIFEPLQGKYYTKPAPVTPPPEETADSGAVG